MNHGITPRVGATPAAAAPVSLGAYDALFLSKALGPPAQPGALASLDRFAVVRQIGSGGMGIVFEGTDLPSKARVALKMLRPEFVAFPEAVRRFLTEAGHMHQLSHPNILRVSEVVPRPAGPYYVMPFMESGPLSAKIGRGRPLDGPTVVGVARDVADALAYAHGKGIIHRDIKPSNILLGDDGRAYLSDFGLVRTVFNDEINGVADLREGTAAYMSPAVAAGGAEDTRCDIYSFGATLYEMLAGVPPYEGRTADQVVQRVLEGPPPPLGRVSREAPAGLVKIVEGSMARELRDRYAQMSDVLADLDRHARGEPIHGPHGPRPGKPARRTAAAAFAAAILAATAVFWGTRHDRRTAAIIPPARLAPATRPQSVPSVNIAPSRTPLQLRLDTLDESTTELHLEDQPVTDTDLAAVERCVRLERLWLRGAPLTDAGLNHLKGLTRLRSIGLTATHVTGRGFEGLQSLTHLESVVVGDCPVNDQGLSCIARLPALQALILRNTNVTDAGMPALATATQLRDLDLWGLPISNAGLARLQPLVNVVSLNLRGTRITDAGLRALTGMHNLARLELRYNPSVTGTGLSSLHVLEHLRSLDLCDTGANDDAMDAVSRLTHLIELNLHGTSVTDRGAVALKALTGLKSLDVSGTQITQAGIDLIQKSVPGVSIRR